MSCSKETLWVCLNGHNILETIQTDEGSLAGYEQLGGLKIPKELTTEILFISTRELDPLQ
jgi:hypothetical protein